MGLERRPCSVDKDGGGQVEVVHRLSETSATARAKHTWAYVHSGLVRKWDEAKHQLIVLVLLGESLILYFPI